MDQRVIQMSAVWTAKFDEEDEQDNDKLMQIQTRLREEGSADDRMRPQGTGMPLLESGGACFEECVFLCKTQRLDILPRKPEVIVALAERMAMVEREWITRKDFILKHFFDWPAEMDQQSGKMCIIKRQTEDHVEWSWKHNEFPYYLEADIEHWLLWVSLPVSQELISQELTRRLDGKCMRYCFAAQRRAKMTIPEIYHVQVFVVW